MTFLSSKRRAGLPGFFFFAFLAITALMVIPLPSARAQLPIITFVRDPDLAPDFKLKDLAGKDLNLEVYRGKVILLNFWATWCGPCREEIPELIALQNRYKDRLQIIGLVVDDDDEKAIRKVIESEGINYPVALADPETRFAYAGIAALPTVFVINSEGRVVQKHVGLFNPALYETEVRALLGLPVAAKVALAVANIPWRNAAFTTPLARSARSAPLSSSRNSQSRKTSNHQKTRTKLPRPLPPLLRSNPQSLNKLPGILFSAYSALFLC